MKLGAHLPLGISNIEVTSGMPAAVSNLSELGLTSDQIRITPTFYHQGIKTDDFGPEASANVMAFIGSCNINMTLIHYDPQILDYCMSESMGGTTGGPFFRTQLYPSQTNMGAYAFAGTLSPAGTLLGNNSPVGSSGNHFISLNILSPSPVTSGTVSRGQLVVSGIYFPWRFPAAYLSEPPVQIPLGTQASLVSLNWTAVPYVVPPNIILPGSSSLPVPGEYISSGAVLWDHQLDL